MNKFKKFGVAALTLLPSLAVMAEESGGTSSTSVGDQIVTQGQTALEALLSTAGTAVVSIVGVGLAIWAGIAIIGLLKRSFNAGKGR